MDGCRGSIRRASSRGGAASAGGNLRRKRSFTCSAGAARSPARRPAAPRHAQRRWAEQSTRGKARTRQKVFTDTATAGTAASSEAGAARAPSPTRSRRLRSRRPRGRCCRLLARRRRRSGHTPRRRSTRRAWTSSGARACSRVDFNESTSSTSTSSSGRACTRRVTAALAACARGAHGALGHADWRGDPVLWQVRERAAHRPPCREQRALGPRPQGRRHRKSTPGSPA